MKKTRKIQKGGKEMTCKDLTSNSFFQNPTYQNGYFDNCKLQQLPDKFYQMTYLKKIILSNNLITSISGKIGIFSQLTKLDLANNKLTNLPESIGKLIHLIELYLEHNNLTHLPESIGNLTKLEFFKLNNNQLIHLPESIGNLTQLAFLNLGNNNQLICLPESIGNLKKLISLSLEDDNSLVLPKSFFKLTQQITIITNGLNLPNEIPPNFDFYSENFDDDDDDDDDDDVNYEEERRRKEKLDKDLRKWKFTTNIPAYQTTPTFLYNQNPYLIHYVSYEGYEYPIITLPKGMILFTCFFYNNEDEQIKEKKLYNIDSPKLRSKNLQTDLKFFYPLPYAGMGVKPYNGCSIVTLRKDIQILALVCPSPVNRAILKNYLYVSQEGHNENYYNNGFTYSCKAFSYDLCILPQMMKELNLQGYLTIAKEDSINYGAEWSKILNDQIPGNGLATDILNNLIFKSCLAPYVPNDSTPSNLPKPFNIPRNGLATDIPRNGLATDIPRNGLATDIPRNGLATDIPRNGLATDIPRNGLATDIPITKQVIGIPEIVLSVVHTDYFDTLTRSDLSTHFETNKDKLNYQTLKIVDMKQIKSYLESIASEIVQNNQSPCFLLHRPSISPDYTFFTQKIKKYNEMQLSDLNYLESYQHPTGPIQCAVDTFGYHYLTRTTTTGGRHKRKIRKTRKKRGGKMNWISSQPLSQPNSFPMTIKKQSKNIPIYSVTNQVPTTTTNQVPTTTNPVPTTTNPVPTTTNPVPTQISVKTISQIQLEMTTNNIPILYFI